VLLLLLLVCLLRHDAHHWRARVEGVAPPSTRLLPLLLLLRHCC
jgi:hypothetical protein